jgi:hypothetical protein
VASAPAEGTFARPGTWRPSISTWRNVIANPLLGVGMADEHVQMTGLVHALDRRPQRARSVVL